jgi:hypothetical protein
MTAFRQGLNDGGYVENRTVGIEYRWAEGRMDRLVEMAAELVRRQVATIVATPGTAVSAAKAATSDIPKTVASYSTATEILCERAEPEFRCRRAHACAPWIGLSRGRPSTSIESDSGLAQGPANPSVLG